MSAQPAYEYEYTPSPEEEALEAVQDFVNTGHRIMIQHMGQLQIRHSKFFSPDETAAYENRLRAEITDDISALNDFHDALDLQLEVTNDSTYQRAIVQKFLGYGNSNMLIGVVINGPRGPQKEMWPLSSGDQLNLKQPNPHY